jgi:hypothetical protein
VHSSELLHFALSGGLEQSSGSSKQLQATDIRGILRMVLCVPAWMCSTFANRYGRL